MLFAGPGAPAGGLLRAAAPRGGGGSAAGPNSLVGLVQRVIRDSITADEVGGDLPSPPACAACCPAATLPPAPPLLGQPG